MNEKLKQLLLTIALLLIFGFAIYSNIMLLIRNYHLSQQIDRQTKLVAEMRDRNYRLKLLNQYFASNSFMDIEARRRLAVKLPEDQVLDVKGLDFSPAESSSMDYLDKIYVDTSSDNAPAPETNPMKWWRFIFKAQRT